MWLNDPETYAGGSVATGRAFHARHVEGDDPDKKGTLVLQVGGWRMRLKLIQKSCNAAKSEIQFRISITINQYILRSF